MSRVTYEILAKLPLVEKYEKAFRRATGVALKLVPAGAPADQFAQATKQNPFCQVLASKRAAEENCCHCEAEIQRRVGRTLASRTLRCFAGLEVVAAPVIVEGRHLATWIGGQVLCRKPTRASFMGVARQLAGWGRKKELLSIQAAFFHSQVVPADQLQAMKQLLTLFAQHLGECADRLWMAPSQGEPVCVARAKEFVQAHVTETMSLAQVSSAAHVSPYHFCRVFRTATGLTVMEYVSRLRVEKAKTMLADASIQVAEVAYATGFGSISQFNTVFRRYVEQSPTQYRIARR